ncbi:Tyrosine-sulfated glycopeptide receptor 1 [Abeliophyllum distichum]|uniref:Tyrosine-sulfated glycopeptide receptor 1 n=1 Tax=Abeliophyllum distichum TaxID=126358 RepID=A0ABD1RY64_9LAMI
MSLKRLEIVDLSYNRLLGNFAASDKLPATIQMVDLSSNQFHGTIECSFFELALNFQSFNINNNSFSGPIPSSICFGQCSNLLSLRAGFNNLSEGVPKDIYMVPILQELYLPANRLSGVIDGTIVNLINLRTLALYGNKLTGIIPQHIGTLSNLEHLLLHINKLNGTLPQSLTNCTRLTALNLRVNLLEGELSAFDFSKFIQLRSIDLGLNGEVLPDIMALQSLSFLSLSNNRLNNFTSAMRILTGCKNLTTLILSKNLYNEPLPGDENLIRADEFQNLQVLGLGGRGFTGQIPMWLSRLDKLEVLDLSLNNITGSVPGWFGNLPNLFYLDLSQNLLSGYFTKELIKLRRLATQQTSDQVDQSYLELPVFVQPNNASNLQYNRLSNLPPAIYLRSNNISGTISIEIGQLKFIVALDLSNNNFFGSIPDTISYLTNLEKLDLSGNHLSGQIPQSLKNLHFLSFFSVAYNYLEGPIPVGGHFDTFPNSSFEGNPGLCGLILQRLCAYKPKTEIRQGPKKEIINWHGFGISYGVSFILAVSQLISAFYTLIRIWAFEAIPNLGKKFAKKYCDGIPRMLGWEQPKRLTSSEVVNLEVISTLIPTEVELEEVYWKELTPCVEEEDTDSQDSKGNDTEHDGEPSHSFHQHSPQVSQPPPVCHDHNIADVVRMEMEKLEERLLGVISKKLDRMEYKIDSLVELAAMGRFHSTTNVPVSPPEVKRRRKLGLIM